MYCRVLNRFQTLKTVWDQYITVRQKSNAMDPRNPREQEPIDTEMLDAVRSKR